MSRQTRAGDRQYRIFNIKTSRTCNDKVFIHSYRSGKSVLLSLSDAQLLLSCQTFQPLTVHAKRYCQKLKRQQVSNQKGIFGKWVRSLLQYATPEGRELPVQKKEIAPFRKKLEKWVEEGLLVSEADLKNDIIILSQPNGRKQEEPDAHKISVVGIPTRGQPKPYYRTLLHCKKFSGFFRNY